MLTPLAQWNEFEVNIPSGLNFYPVAQEDGTGVSTKTAKFTAPAP